MDDSSESNLLNTSQGTIENLIQKLNDSYNIRRKLEAEIKALKESINSPVKSQAKNTKSATLEKDKESLSKSLHAADLKIESLTIQNDILRRELNEVRQRSTTLEDLLKESSLGLEKMQLKIDSDAVGMLEINERIQKAEAKNASLERANLVLQARIRREEQSINNNLDHIKTEVTTGTTSVINKKNTTTTTTSSRTPSSEKHKKFHISVRDTLRQVADQLCDQLVQVEEQLEFSKSFVKIEEPDPYQSNAGRQTKHSRGNNKGSSSQHTTNQKHVPDFQFGRPSTREVLNIVQENDEEESEQYE